MTYHKIKGIPLDVCTAEQMAAYKAAYDCFDLVSLYYRQAKRFTRLQEDEVFIAYRDFCLKTISDGAGECDIDSIFCALNAGLRNYFKHDGPELSYSQIGKMFPAEYLRTA